MPRLARGFPRVSTHLPHLKSHTEVTQIGEAKAQLVPLSTLIEVASTLIRDDPTALLCNNPNCQRCQTVRAEVGKKE